MQRKYEEKAQTIPLGLETGKNDGKISNQAGVSLIWASGSFCFYFESGLIFLLLFGFSSELICCWVRKNVWEWWPVLFLVVCVILGVSWRFSYVLEDWNFLQVTKNTWMFLNFLIFFAFWSGELERNWELGFVAWWLRLSEAMIGKKRVRINCTYL